MHPPATIERVRALYIAGSPIAVAAAAGGISAACAGRRRRQARGRDDDWDVARLQATAAAAPGAAVAPDVAAVARLIQAAVAKIEAAVAELPAGMPAAWSLDDGQVSTESDRIERALARLRLMLLAAAGAVVAACALCVWWLA